MEFHKMRVYTAVNADELHPGDKVIVADSLGQLMDKVENDYPLTELNGYKNGYAERRFSAKDGFTYALAYLVERKENCTMCKKNHLLPNGCESLNPYCLDEEEKKTLWCRYFVRAEPIEHNCVNCGKTSCGHSGVKGLEERTCENWQDKKKYRPFKDTDELIKVWESKCKDGGMVVNSIDMPLIWVRSKEDNTQTLITAFEQKYQHVRIGGVWNEMNDLFKEYEFLDGSPCGVEE